MSVRYILRAHVTPAEQFAETLKRCDVEVEVFEQHVVCTQTDSFLCLLDSRSTFSNQTKNSENN